MNILLVDDHRPSIEMLKDIVNWDQFMIKEVFLAECVDDARVLLQRSPIDYVICDIEMPGENGLDLLRWIRQKDLNPEVAFFTCHNNFQYAKEAMQLGCHEYLLKPAANKEIHALLQRMTQTKKSHDSERNFLTERQQLIEEQFWGEVLWGHFDSIQSIEKFIKEKNITIETTQSFTILLVCLKVNNSEDIMTEDGVFFALKKIAEDLILAHTGAGSVIVSHSMLTMFFPTHLVNTSTLHELCDQYIEQCKTNLSCKITCCYEENIRINEITDTYARIKKCNEYNTFYSSGVFTFEALNEIVLQKSKEIVMPDEEKILRLMLSLQFDKTNSYLYHWIKLAAHKQSINRKTLVALQSLVMRISDQVCLSYNINQNEYLKDDRSIELYAKAILDAKKMIRFLNYFFMRFKIAADLRHNKNTLSDNIVKYINFHYASDISISEISDAIGVSPSHAMRVFKSELGLSIGEYLSRTRINNAKVLLLGETYTISQISTMVGFNSSAYFTKIFKRYTGQKPSEYKSAEISSDHKPAK